LSNFKHKTSRLFRIWIR